MATPIGTPKTEAILKPAKIHETRPARLSRGAIVLAKVMINEMIEPAVVAVMTLEMTINR